MSRRGQVVVFVLSASWLALGGCQMSGVAPPPSGALTAEQESARNTAWQNLTAAQYAYSTATETADMDGNRSEAEQYAIVAAQVYLDQAKMQWEAHK